MRSAPRLAHPPGPNTGAFRPSSPTVFDGDDRPVDLVHLARQTFGDKRLETELLRLFARQASHILEKVDRLEEPGDLSHVDLLHSLVGSARVVGAQRVARCAEELETVLRCEGALEVGARLTTADRLRLRREIDDACTYIKGLLGR